MIVLFEYLLQVSFILALFYAIYYLILRNERFFVEIRIYLIISILLSLLLPFVRIPYTVIVETVQASVQSDLIPMFSGVMDVEPTKQNYFTMSNMLLIGYLIVVAVLLILSLLKISQICRLVLGKKYTIIEDCKLVILDKYIPAFTFFGYIVMNREEFTDESRTNILAHEKVHADQKHWIDLLLVELLTILVWFNPIVWLYQVAIKQTHELLADDGVIARGFNIGQYQATLINQLMGTEVLGLANNFNHSITKKRMIMMSNIKSPKNRRYKLLIMIPAVLAILLFNLKIVEVQAQEKTIKEVVNVTTVSGQVLNEDNEPIAGVAVLVQDSKTGTVTDMDGKFSLVVPLDAKLVFLGVNFNKEIISVKGFMEYGKKTDSGYDMNVQLSSSSAKEVREQKTYKGEPIFVIVEDMPEYPGGPKALREYIAENVKYPAEAIKNNIRGRVFVTFVVTKDGNVDQSRVVRGVEPSLNAEAVRVINTIPKWKPGKQRGQAVNVAYTVPINFDFEDDTTKEEEERKASSDSKGEQIFVKVEKMPQYPGGSEALLAYIEESTVYPSVAFVNGIKGRVFVTFVVNKEGDVDQARVVRGVETTLDAEALRVVKSLPKWTPGYEKGKAVSVSYTVPINFDFNDDKKIDEVKVEGKSKINQLDGTAPKFPGGELELQKFVARGVKYPKDAQEKGEEGRVFVTFTINKLGIVESVRTAKSVSPSLDAEAIRVIKTLPTWIPASRNGESVEATYTLPINFELKDNQGVTVMGEAEKEEFTNNDESGSTITMLNKTENKKTSTGNKTYNGEPVYVLVDDMPKYPGGALKLKEYIESEVSKLDSKYIIHKRCFITFLVTKTGAVDNLKIARGTNNVVVDNKALEIIKNMPKWTPGYEKGIAVSVSYTVPINFDLKNDEKK
ncbi:hypothetical protein BZG02_19425 [Labilibaculum filiforme]|uniref:TonB C-terminal domain-containing protein n=1 Tax=Labilibaculum filiforme TaxID=1940526 RepID=A0A2N3HQV1_9BACT|nr:TonB family protein [Labilibaculum filiforme]PKQ60435.1 hypothetical protein BZG02_19425 [Labilibaculum filiforme]